MNNLAGASLTDRFKDDFLKARGSESADTVSRGRILARQIGPGELMQASHELRYQTYCIDRQFLRADEYPDGSERDQYDRISTHFGVFMDEVSPDRMVATARLVPGDSRFPLHDHCAISPRYNTLFKSGVRAAEISRLMISQTKLGSFLGHGHHRCRKDILIALYKAMYLWVEAHEVSLLFAAMEPALARLLCKTGFPFIEIGPEADYYGRVFPFVLDIEFTKMYLRTRVPEISDFLLDTEASEASNRFAGHFNPQTRVA